MGEADKLNSTDLRGGLASRSFVGLLVTQFLGALNDNMFRWLVVPIGMPILGNAEALSLGVACFTLPYLLFMPFAGYLADRFDKRRVIVGCKVAEIVLMSSAVGAILFGDVHLLFFVVGLMGMQSALFSPSKFGSIPEILKPEKISTGNGWMAMVTVVASALGTFTGYQLFAITGKPDLRQGVLFADIWPAGVALVGTAIAGCLTSLAIARLPVADPHRRLPRNPFPETLRNLRLLAKNVLLLRTALGIAFFWMLASLAQVNINTFGMDVLGLEEQELGTLMVILVAGVGLGSMMAGIWSGGKVELGIVPLGALGIVISSILLFWAGSSVDPAVATSLQDAYWWSCVCLFGLGFSAGLFNIPLAAFLQHRSEAKTRGSILAASNFISFSFIMASAGLFYVMQRPPLDMSPAEIFLVAGLGTVPVAVYVFSLLPGATIRFVVWLASHSVYRVRVHGRENLPEIGGALLVANHVSWLDGVLLLMTSSRPIRMLAYADYIEWWGLRWLARIYGVIPIKAEFGPRAMLRALKTAREAVTAGELVCIFAEGEITRTGQLQAFNRGLMRIVQGTGAPVVPVYLDELWGSIFSYRGGRLFWKRPRHWPYPVSILFGKALGDPETVNQVRQAVEDLGVEAVQKRKARRLVLQRQFLRKCRTSLFRSKVADSSGTDLTGGRLLTGTLVFKRILERSVLSPDENMIGVLLPPAVGSVIANTAVSLMRRVAVNLNYTLSNDLVNCCIEQCEIKHVLTSRRFLEKRPFDLNAELVYLEDLKEQAGGLDKMLALLQAYALPVALLERMLGLTRIRPDDLLTVIFTSGSTGEPKGVMLSDHNVNSNVDAVDQLFHIDKSDVLLGVLPFFHSFGYTTTLWLPMALEPKTVYHFNPLDARQIGKLSAKHGTTIILATPTFLRTYLKRCDPADLSRLDIVAVGAEKMPLELSKAFEAKFGVAPTEGYGATELSPVAAFNIPEHRAQAADQVVTKLGTVGRVMPGAAAKVVDPGTGEDRGTDTEGLLLIRGPNVMLGYLNDPEKTAAVIRDGWYDTGDFAKIDDDGFIEITGRQSRFSKIGGEMVPHLKIEEALSKIVDEHDTDEPEIIIAVTAVPDEKKGERIIVIHKRLPQPVEQILKQLAETGLPNLWLPAQDSFLEVDEIPLLGTGKLDLKGLKQTALKRFGRAPAEQ